MYKGFLVLGALALSTSALAADDNANDNAAVRIEDAACLFLDGNGDVAVANTSHTVITNPGTLVLICHEPNVPNDTGRAVRWNFENTGGTCGTLAGTTEDWTLVITPSGRATLTCIVHQD